MAAQRAFPGPRSSWAGAVFSAPAVALFQAKPGYNCPTMGCRFGCVWTASVLTIATLAAQPSGVSDTQNTARLKATLTELNRTVNDQHMPNNLRWPAQHCLEWLGRRLLAKDQKWTDESGRKSKRAQPLPAAYLESLELDLKTLQAALADTDGKRREDMALSVVQDLKVKSDDCLKFGRGRLVEVQVSTVKSGHVVNNWQVYYKYAAVGDLPTAKLPMESLSSPARKLLPPGQYDFQAEAAEGGNFVESSVVRCAVGGVPVMKLEIPILH